jgi:hypothetical protein
VHAVSWVVECVNTVNTRRNCVCTVLSVGLCQYTVNTWRNWACSGLSGAVCQHCEYMKGAKYAVS